MESPTVQTLLQQAAKLSPLDKLALVEQLIHQARLDVQPLKNGNRNGAVNGQEHERDGDKPDPYRRRELEWLKQNEHEYAGQYVALLSDRLVAHAATLPELDRLVAESGTQGAVITRIKAQGEMLFGGW